MGKQMVIDHVPKRIKALKFGIMSPQELVRQGVTEVTTRELYELGGPERKPVAHGALDRRMGTSSKDALCETCGERVTDCVGHFGHVKLALPAFHIGYFKHILNTLSQICKECSRVLLDEEMRRSMLRELRKPIDNLKRQSLHKRILDHCKKMRHCPFCHAPQGVVKKAGPLKIIHDKYRYAGRKGEDAKREFDNSFVKAVQASQDMRSHLNKAMDDLNPLRVLNLFQRISMSDCELLGIDPEEGRPEMLLWQYIPAPPVCIRPTVTQDGGVTEDDITAKLTEIVFNNALIKAALDKGTPIATLMEQWDYLQLSIAMYINSDMPGVPISQAQKPMRGFCQRLKGKQGRFRGNLSGKRVDFSGRTVIGPDPNLAINQVGVPERVAKTLTFPEKVTAHNMAELRERILNGPDKHPGANFVRSSNGFSRYLKFADRQRVADTLKIGDIVDRHIRDGDCILFNRQPSLHKLSIMCHFAKIRPWRTLRLNECACGPYGADFDGDEMNLHVPQTEEARTEAQVLMGVKDNLVTPKNGEPVIAAIQDFITASFLLSQKDAFFDRKTFVQTVSMMADADLKFDLPPPVIVKPVALWTGKQIFSLLMKPNRDSNVLVNLEAKCRSFSGGKYAAEPDMCPNDGYLVIQGSQVMCGVMDKSTVGDGKKNSLFYVILRDYGSKEAIAAMSRLAKLCARHLGNQGFSLGISDVQASAPLRAQKDRLVDEAEAQCEELIRQYRKGRLPLQPGCNAEQTLEAKISGVLSRVRDGCGEICMDDLPKTNAPIIMATCGSKGSKINVSQMVSCVGQQIISGFRVPDGFQDRSLPHFAKNSKEPGAKGFVRNSFYTGLSPPEFLFHAISGREGLVDTAVKTAETGYMSRRLMKSLEDLSVKYDATVRNASSGIVQFVYGDDGLDPTFLEGDGVPVEFVRTWSHCRNVSGLAGRILTPEEMMDRAREAMSQAKWVRGCTEDFRETVASFLQRLATRRAELLARFPEGDEAGRTNADNILAITNAQLDVFLQTCLHKYITAKVEPGTAVGAVGAQSIGEPGTQMTLKTFHFAGVASMNITLGVPRIKEIINAAKSISTPIITCKLVNEVDEISARVVKGRVEVTRLEDICSYISEIWSAQSVSVEVRVDWDNVRKLQLDLKMSDIQEAIMRDSRLKLAPGTSFVDRGETIRIRVRMATEKDTKEHIEMLYKVQWLKRALPKVVVAGVTTTSRAVINKTDTNANTLLVEGYGLKEVMAIDGVVGTDTYTNHIIEMRQVLGIEAARASIIKEVSTVMRSHGMNVDPRHILLLGDVMTYKGEILGITRFGIAKMKDSVLMLASFEKTTDHLFDAAARLAQDAIEGVSECIILGVPAPIGTGAFKVIRLSEQFLDKPRKKPVFDDPELHVPLASIAVGAA
ncbi:DNA-directed RNA polymerase III subunit C1 (rpo31) [Savitreella phatthalungensis]